MYSIKEKVGFILLVGFVLTAFIGVLLQEPIAQDISYHSFKDSKEMMGIANFCNVFSNVAFLIVGILGLKNSLANKNIKMIRKLKPAYILLFVATGLVAFGSGYYHLNPNNDTLLWDRLPMTIAFMALITIIIGEFISIKAAQKLLLPFVILGIASVLYWHWGESRGAGDLRYYVLVQYLPILSIPVILLCFQSIYTKASGYWWLLLAYVIAKLLEYFDGEVFDLLGVISGHSLKHVAAAIGLYILLYSYQRREYKI